MAFNDNTDDTYGPAARKRKLTPGAPASPTGAGIDAPLNLPPTTVYPGGITDDDYSKRQIPASQPGLVGAGPVPSGPSDAYTTGQDLRRTAGNVAGAVNSSVVQPVLGIGSDVGAFGRGLIGADPAGTNPTATGASTPATTPAMAGVNSSVLNPGGTPVTNPATSPASGRLNILPSNGLGPRGAALLNSGVGSIGADGTPTFTYNPDGSGNVPKSFVDATSKGPSNPYLGPEGGIGSAAGINTVEQGAAIRAPQAATYDNSGAEQNAQSDLASVLSRDPRSVLGRAAWNSQFLSQKGRRVGRYGTGPSAADTAFGALLGNVAATQVQNSRGALENQTGANAITGEQIKSGDEAAAQAATTGRMILQQQGEDRRARVNAAQTQIGNDNNLYSIKDGISSPITTADGTPFQPKNDPFASRDRVIESLTRGGAMTVDEANKYFDQSRNPSPAAGSATATGKDGTKYKLSPDGKSWVKANG